MKVTVNRWIIGVCFSIALTAYSTYADSPAGMYLGILGGVASPTVNGTDYLHDRFTYGTQVGYRFSELVDAGLYVTYSQKQENSSGSNHFFLLAGVEGNFYSSWIKGLHGGLKAGLTRGKIYIPTIDAGGVPIGVRLATEFSFGPKIGYDYALSETVSIGAELESMFNTDNKYCILNYLAALKYRFGQ